MAEVTIRTFIATTSTIHTNVTTIMTITTIIMATLITLTTCTVISPRACWLIPPNYATGTLKQASSASRFRAFMNTHSPRTRAI